MYRLVASDMDDTFLGHGHAIIPVNTEALLRMRELGILFVPASGRPYPSVMESLSGLDSRILEGSYVISLNGALVNRAGDPDPISSTWMDRAMAEELWARGREMGLCMHAYTADGSFYVASTSEAERAWLEGFDNIHDVGPAPADLSFVGEKPVVKILYQSDDFAWLQRLGRSMEAELDPSVVAVTYSSNRYCEFMPAGVTKGTGLEELASLMGIDMAETVGVGDAANDIGLLDAAGLGVGVANATPDLLPHCDVVLRSSAYEGAFPELLERFLEPAVGA